MAQQSTWTNEDIAMALAMATMEYLVGDVNGKVPRTAMDAFFMVTGGLPVGVTC